eukprot:5061875-Lingulodinium_polyedra.AAC.1
MKKGTAEEPEASVAILAQGVSARVLPAVAAVRNAPPTVSRLTAWRRGAAVLCRRGGARAGRKAALRAGP